MRLIDADALIGDLHNHAFLEGDDRAIVYNIIQKQPTACAWVSVKDKMPEQYESVLVFVQREEHYWYLATAYINIDGSWTSSKKNFLENNECITHWMPLPVSLKEVHSDGQ